MEEKEIENNTNKLLQKVVIPRSHIAVWPGCWQNHYQNSYEEEIIKPEK